MPVRKFRSAEETNQAAWRQPGDPAPASIWEFGRRLRPQQFTPGVRKFRSIEEMEGGERTPAAYAVTGTS
jgi:hypothetical protein